jgi:hypothetical protein
MDGDEIGGVLPRCRPWTIIAGNASISVTVLYATVTCFFVFEGSLVPTVIGIGPTEQLTTVNSGGYRCISYYLKIICLVLFIQRL